MPSFNPTPVKTGRITLHFERTFRHYILNGLQNDDQGDTWNHNWQDIPYQHICASLKPRDWQMINTVAKRWRVLSCGFDMEHIIPFINETKTVGGAIEPHISFNLMPYMECFIDKGYVLPPLTAYTTSSLPNNNFMRNSSNQSEAALTKYIFEKSLITTPDVANAYRINYLTTPKMDYFDLMNSREWKTVQPTDNLSFEWTNNIDDSTWRHALIPPDSRADTGPGTILPASMHGRWDGFNGSRNPNDLTQANVLYRNSLKHNPSKPAPAVLVRPMEMHDSGGNCLNLSFQALVRYHSTIEIDVNDVGWLPIWLTSFNGTPSGAQWQYLYDLSATSTSAAQQYPGANHVNMLTGPGTAGMIV